MSREVPSRRLLVFSGSTGAGILLVNIWLGSEMPSGVVLVSSRSAGMGALRGDYILRLLV